MRNRVDVVMMYCLLVILLFVAGIRNDDQCSAAHANGVKFRITSRRNVTGHRIIKAIVNSNSSLQLQEAGANEEVTLDISHGSVLCQEVEQLIMEADIVLPPNKVRRPDYELFTGLGFYKLHPTPLKWEEARRKCFQEGAHLAIINSLAEAKVLGMMFSRAPKTIQDATYSHVAAIGFHDSTFEGHYLTIFGQSLTDAGYNEWAASQPNNGAGSIDADSDCGAVQRDGKLNDIPCNSKVAFLCEQEL